MEYFFAAALFGYLLGSVPFGLVLCKIFGYGDIRKIGSGNIGATNVLRTGNKPLALTTLLLDSGKGAIAVLTVLFILKSIGGDSYTDLSSFTFDNLQFRNTDLATFAGLGAVLGHCYPVWLKFKGGKGVATTLGTLFAISLPLGIVACLIWLSIALIFRISSLAALIAIISTPFLVEFFPNLMSSNSFMVEFCIALTVIIYVKHRENIMRLVKRKEPSIGNSISKKIKVFLMITGLSIITFLCWFAYEDSKTIKFGVSYISKEIIPQAPF